MERNDQTKEKLQTTHEQCRAFTMSMEKLELIEMVDQTKRVEQIIRNHRDWVDLYNSLKMLKEQ